MEQEQNIQETLDTGVIYLVTNSVNSKMYVGQANSYVKNGAAGITYYGSNGRWRWHIGNIHSNDIKRQLDCPFLYEALISEGEYNFKHQVIEVCLKSNLDEREEYHIRRLVSHLSTIGYNYWIGKKKPEDPERLARFLSVKEHANKSRAEDGKMKRSIDSKGLPTNITPYKNKGEHLGYSVCIKINGNQKNKSFASKQYTMDEKLQLAITWLKNAKLELESM